MKHLIYKSTYPVICIVLLSFSCSPEKLDPLNYEDPIFDSQIDVLESVQEDKMAPIGRLLDTDSTLLLTDSFKSKLLFIDFWATWCTPCIAQIPKFHEVGGKYDSENVAFVSICINEEEFGFWKEMLDEKGWKDHHYLALSPNNSAFAGFIHGIPPWADIPKGSAAKMFPTYALISPKGIVIDRNFARPLNSSFDDSVKLAINEHL